MLYFNVDKKISSIIFNYYNIIREGEKNMDVSSLAYIAMGIFIIILIFLIKIYLSIK